MYPVIYNFCLPFMLGVDTAFWCWRSQELAIVWDGHHCDIYILYNRHCTSCLNEQNLQQGSGLMA